MQILSVTLTKLYQISRSALPKKAVIAIYCVLVPFERRLCENYLNCELVGMRPHKT